MDQAGRVSLALGSSYALELIGGTGYFDVTASGTSATLSGEVFDSFSEGLTDFVFTDHFTGQSTTVAADVVASQQIPLARSGDAVVQGSLAAAGAANGATQLVNSSGGPDLHILSDQGTADDFYKAGAEGCQLLPENFAKACGEKGVELKLNMREGYDHSYYFIASFIDDHIKHHASFLKA